MPLFIANPTIICLAVPFFNNHQKLKRMQLYQSIKNVFVQLDDSLQQLTDTQYTQPSKRLFNATIGQHVRHIIELFVCLQKGYETGVVNYEKRKRDLQLETDKEFA